MPQMLAARPIASTLFESTMARYPEVTDPEHTAAVSFMASWNVFRELVDYLKPKDEVGAIARDGSRTELRYSPMDQRPGPQFKFVVAQAESSLTVSVVDLVLPLPYIRNKTTLDFANIPVRRGEAVHTVPLLIMVQLDPPTIEPVLLEVSLIRNAIIAGLNLTGDLSELDECEFMLATRQRLGDAEGTMLIESGIHHYVLGTDFETYWQQWDEGREDAAGEAC